MVILGYPYVGREADKQSTASRHHSLFYIEGDPVLHCMYVFPGSTAVSVEMSHRPEEDGDEEQ